MAGKTTSVLFLVLVCAAVCTVAHSKRAFRLERKNIFQMWEEFKAEHEKAYESERIEERCFRIFSDNLDLIDSLNLEAEGNTEYGITPFADMTQEEFKDKVLMPSRAAEEFEASRYRKAFKTVDVGVLPTSYNWVDHGAVTSVKNQGSVGTCWSFSTVGNIEGQWALAGNTLVSLSEEQLVDCSSNTNAPNADCGVFGGWPYLAMEYVIAVGGIASEEAYPYCVGISGPNACYPCSAPGYNAKLCGPGLYPPACNSTKWPCRQGKVPYTAQITGWQAISQNETLIQQALYEIGPLSALLNAANLQFYRKGVFEPRICSPKNLDHAVLITGWGVTNSTDPDDPNTPYWIVKNSWGAKWGQNGYFWIKRGVGQCGINQQVITSVVGNSKQEVVEI